MNCVVIGSGSAKMKRKRVAVIAVVVIVGVAIAMYLVLRGSSGPPTQDAPGTDISDVPRYPGSIRSWGESTSAGYYTSTDVNTVANWYETGLPGYGWENISITPWVGGAFEGDLKLAASKDSKSLSMTIAKSALYDGYTIIGIGILPEET